MYNVTLIPGDGIGPEVTGAARRVLEATGVKFDWDIQQAGEAQIAIHGSPMPEETMHSIERTKLALKGPVNTPKGGGFRSVNVLLRQKFDLYANLRPAKTIPNIMSRYENVDIVVVRENTEDLYAGIEHMVGEDAAESIKIITRKGCERIARFAFDYAVKNGRKKVTAVHKANIMKCTDGLFLKVVGEVAKEYPAIQFEDVIVDAMCMKLVQTPENYDVLVLPNLYGDIVSDLCAGLVGGLGIAPGANIGVGCSVFEAIHGGAPDIAGKGIANPTAVILSGAMMLRHLGEAAAADKVESAIVALIQRGEVTRDLGGSLGTDAFTDSVIREMAR
ncbi:MAG: isocitrate/isopropylmalate dehydrogenase family protein [Oscillospiraceae bacterium]|nr:isocitrate/isopropylmalate dehydrogenase family protein [Oscillospiraceae bacterium]